MRTAAGSQLFALRTNTFPQKARNVDELICTNFQAIILANKGLPFETSLRPCSPCFRNQNTSPKEESIQKQMNVYSLLISVFFFNFIFCASEKFNVNIFDGETLQNLRTSPESIKRGQHPIQKKKG